MDGVANVFKKGWHPEKEGTTIKQQVVGSASRIEAVRTPKLIQRIERRIQEGRHGQQGP
jgi:hypothetical protein